MVIDRQRGSWKHRTFKELPDLLRAGDLLVRNNSRVVPARLVGQRAMTGGKWVGLFVRDVPDFMWEILATTRGRPVSGEHIIIGQGLHLVLDSKTKSGSWIVRPEQAGYRPLTTLELLEKHGQTPLPPYIRRGQDLAGDQSNYQTIYAQRSGSIAAPTAGLHFTDELFRRLTASKINWIDLTLHVGLGTFRPIESTQLENHVMHAEWAELTAESVTCLNSRRREGGRVVAVGSTSARVLETAASSGTLEPFSGETNLFIQPGHVFHGLDALITNFHLPRSSLLVLVSAFAGVELMRAVYAEAVRSRYRFFSYGDAMLIL